MGQIDRKAIIEFANEHIEDFHTSRLRRLSDIKLNAVVKRKNPYLFRAKNLLEADELVSAMLDALLSSSEEEIFGRFLEKLAIFVSEQAYQGKKSSAEGIDLEFDRDNIRYIVSVKSGPNWGNSSQQKRMKDNFNNALKVQRQGNPKFQVQAVLGICYGKSKDGDKGLYLKKMGQSFWYFLSDDPTLYIDIIEPIGYRAKDHNERFFEEKAALKNRLVGKFIDDFCYDDGRIDWAKLVAFNSGNLEATT
jgi:hypothetical protein